jgi:hypothetical protein
VRTCKVLLCFFVPVVVAFSTHALPQDASPPRTFPTQPTPMTAQDVGGAFWRTDGNFEAVLRLRNLLVTAPILATPVIWLEDGTQYDLPSTLIPASGLTVININQELRDAPANIQAHMSQVGSAGIRYEWNLQDAVVGEVTNTDEIASLVYNTHMGAALQSSGFRKMATHENFVDEGMWWKRDPGVIPYLYIVNVNTSAITAHISVSGSVADSPVTEDVALAAHETNMLSLQPLISRLAHSIT